MKDLLFVRKHYMWATFHVLMEERLDCTVVQVLLYFIFFLCQFSKKLKVIQKYLQQKILMNLFIEERNHKIIGKKWNCDRPDFYTFSNSNLKVWKTLVTTTRQPYPQSLIPSTDSEECRKFSKKDTFIILFLLFRSVLEPSKTFFRIYFGQLYVILRQIEIWENIIKTQSFLGWWWFGKIGWHSAILSWWSWNHLTFNLHC